MASLEQTLLVGPVVEPITKLFVLLLFVFVFVVSSSVPLFSGLLLV
jgi:hypothetical protein